MGIYPTSSPVSTSPEGFSSTPRRTEGAHNDISFSFVIYRLYPANRTVYDIRLNTGFYLLQLIHRNNYDVQLALKLFLNCMYLNVLFEKR